jgi:hypothetical protein
VGKKFVSFPKLFIFVVNVFTLLGKSIIMAFFKGQETFSIDAKNRINIPAKMRKSIAPEANNTFTLTRGQDKCITAYPLDEWRKYEEKFESLNQYDPKKSLLFAYNFELERRGWARRSATAYGAKEAY